MAIRVRAHRRRSVLGRRFSVSAYLRRGRARLPQWRPANGFYVVDKKTLKKFPSFDKLKEANSFAFKQGLLGKRVVVVRAGA